MISVAMATYNGERFIEEQIKSILKQTVKIDELIICDDCSNDETINIVKNIIKDNNSDISIKLIENNKNLGYIENFKKAISLTTGEYIFLSDQDDVWENEKVEKSIKFIKKNNYEAICSKFKLIDDKGNKIDDISELSINKFILNSSENREISFKRLIFGNISPGCTYCFTKKVKDIYLKVDNHNVIHDYQIMLIASNIGKVGVISEELIKYRLHSNNSVGFPDKKKCEKRKIDNIRRKPIMVEFLNTLNKISKVKYYCFYIILYYLRIPYIKARIRRFIINLSIN